MDEEVEEVYVDKEAEVVFDDKEADEEGEDAMDEGKNLGVERSRIDSPWRGYYPQQAAGGPGACCH